MSKHIAYVCNEIHDNGGWTCPYCAGGLFLCTKCGLAEGELTTECPGVPLTHSQYEDLERGTLDFKDGQWKTVNPWYNKKA